MNAYTIKPCNVAACCDVFSPDGKQTSFIFMAEGKPIATIKDETGKEFQAMPLVIRAAVNKHFGTVFALPIDRRGEYLKACIPFTVQEL